MTPELQDRLLAALERPHRLGMIGGELREQLAHCASFSRVLAQVGTARPGSRAVDLGTGGGLPGVALAAVFPDALWTLVEIRTSRATEVERALLGLGLEAVVNTDAAQDLGHDRSMRETFDLAVARSFGPPSMTAECAAGLLCHGGYLVVSEPPGSSAGPEDRWPTDRLQRLGLGAATIFTDDDHTFAVMEKVAESGPRVPRRSAKALRSWS